MKRLLSAGLFSFLFFVVLRKWTRMREIQDESYEARKKKFGKEQKGSNLQSDLDA
jgi:hypothetical protein